MPIKFFNRPVNVTAIVPGTERLIEHPSRETGRPIRPDQAPLQPDSPAAQLQRIGNLADRAVSTAPSNMVRPGTGIVSMVRRTLAAWTPADPAMGFFPTPMKHLMTGDPEKLNKIVPRRPLDTRHHPIHHSQAEEVEAAPVHGGLLDSFNGLERAHRTARQAHDPIVQQRQKAVDDAVAHRNRIGIAIEQSNLANDAANAAHRRAVETHEQSLETHQATIVEHKSRLAQANQDLAAANEAFNSAARTHQEATNALESCNEAHELANTAYEQTRDAMQHAVGQAREATQTHEETVWKIYENPVFEENANADETTAVKNYGNPLFELGTDVHRAAVEANRQAGQRVTRTAAAVRQAAQMSHQTGLVRHQAAARVHAAAEARQHAADALEQAIQAHEQAVEAHAHANELHDQATKRYQQTLAALRDALDKATTARTDADNMHRRLPTLETHRRVVQEAARLDEALSASQLSPLAAATRMETATHTRVVFAAAEIERLAGTPHAPPAGEIDPHRERVDEARQGADRVRAHYDDTLRAAQRRLLDLMSGHPPGFATAGTPALGARLAEFANRLPDHSLRDGIPRAALVETLSRGLAHVTGGDPARSEAALHALMNRPTTDWVPMTQQERQQMNPDVRGLFLLLSTVPRGIEALMLAPLDQAPMAQVATQSLDVRAYWRAEKESLRPDTPPSVREWLGRVQNAAAISIRHPANAANAGNGNPPPVAASRDLAALRAFRMGFHSNAPGSAYAQANERFNQVTGTWVDRADPSTRRPWTRAYNMLNLTPAQAKTQTGAAGTALSREVRNKIDEALQNDQLPDHKLFIAQALFQALVELKLTEAPERPLGANDIHLFHRRLAGTLANAARTHPELRQDLENMMGELLPVAPPPNGGDIEMGMLGAQAAPLDDMPLAGNTVLDALDNLATALSNDGDEANPFEGVRQHLQEARHALNQRDERRAADARDWLSINPVKKTTPLTSTAILAANKVGAAMGVKTPPVIVEEATHAASVALHQAVGTRIDEEVENGNVPTEEAFLARALSAFINERPNLKANHVLSEGDMGHIHRHLRAAIGNVAATAGPLQHPDAQAQLEQRQRIPLRLGEPILPLLDELTTCLREQVPPDSQLYAAAQGQIDTATSLLPMAEHGRIRSPQDLLTMLGSMLDRWDLRTRLRLAGGGTAGKGPTGLSFVFNNRLNPAIAPDINVSVKKESFIDIYHPMQGLQITFGSHSHDSLGFNLSAGPTFKLGQDVLSARVAIGARLNFDDTNANGTILRIRREPGRLPAMIESLKGSLSDMVNWTTLRDENGQGYTDPMEAMLARNDRLIVADMNYSTANSTAEIAGSAIIVAGDPRKGKRWLTSGPRISLSASVDRQQQAYAETKGLVRVTNERNSTATTKVRAGLDWGANIGDPNDHGLDKDQKVKLAGVRGPIILGAIRDVGQGYERNSVTLLNFAGTVDADHDRYYDTPDPLIAEIDANREQWLQRYLETLTGWTEQQKQGPGRVLAEQELDQFRARTLSMKEEGNFAVFNIHDTMMPQAAPQFEMLEMLTGLAEETIGPEEQRAERVKQLKAERDQLLVEPSTWRRSTMNVFERGKKSTSNGVNFWLRAGRHHTGEAQLQLFEFPSRNPAPPPPAEP